MTTVSLQPPVRSGNRWLAKVGDLGARFNPDVSKEVRAAASELGVSADDLLLAIRTQRAADQAAAAPAASAPLVIRGWWEAGGGRPEEVFDSLDTALAAPCDVFAWNGTAHLAALDVDILDPARPFSEREMQALVEGAAAPLPTWGWITRSGGVRLIFDARDDLEAGARASLYLLLTHLSTDDRVKRVELLPRTRRPPGGRQVFRSSKLAGVADLAARIRARGGESAVTLEEIQGWLEQRGLHYGRHSHEHCPIDPKPISGNNPVMVGAEGVWCHYCEGTRGRGFRPWAALVDGEGDGDPDPIAQMAINFVHWTHARLVLMAYNPTLHEAVLRQGYAALMRVLHPEEQDRCVAAFSSTLSFIRGHSGWLRADDYLPHDSIGPGSLRILPWVQGCPVRADLAAGSGRLPGYTPILPVTHLIVRPECHYPHVLVPRKIHTAAMDGSPYPWPVCEELLLQVLEGCSRAWIQAVLGIVVSALRAQRGAPAPLISVLEALPGSGKGAAVALAEGILGAPVAPINLSGRDAQEVATSIGMGLESGAMLLFGDEMGKVREWWSKSAALLGLSDTHAWRKLHVGMVSTPVRAAIVLAASTPPRGFSTMPEFHRRVSIFRLPRVAADTSAQWEERVDSILNVVSLKRLRHSSEGAKLAEGFLAHARTFVPDQPLPPWPEHAKQFGGKRLMDDDPDAISLVDAVRDLYRLWSDQGQLGLQSITDPDDRLRGWFRCYRVANDPKDPRDWAARAVEKWIPEDDSHEVRTAKASQMETVDVPALCGIEEDVRLRVRFHGRRLYVRFIHEGRPRSHYGSWGAFPPPKKEATE